MQKINFEIHVNIVQSITDRTNREKWKYWMKILHFAVVFRFYTTSNDFFLFLLSKTKTWYRRKDPQWCTMFFSWPQNNLSNFSLYRQNMKTKESRPWVECSCWIRVQQCYEWPNLKCTYTASTSLNHNSKKYELFLLNIWPSQNRKFRLLFYGFSLSMLVEDVTEQQRMGMFVLWSLNNRPIGREGNEWKTAFIKYSLRKVWFLVLKSIQIKTRK